MAVKFTAIRGLLLVLVTACASGDGMQNKLRDATSAYNRSLRWGDFDRAAEYLPTASRTHFLSNHEEFTDELVIVDYEVTRLELDKDTGIAASRAEISWHTERRLIVETTVIDQTWQWHDGNFVLVDEHRSDGTSLTVFAEKEDQPHPWLPGLEDYRKDNEIGEENKHAKKRRRRGKRGAGPDDVRSVSGPSARR